MASTAPEPESQRPDDSAPAESTADAAAPAIDPSASAEPAIDASAPPASTAVTDPDAPSATASAEQPAAAAAPAQPAVVYVTAPTPPRARGARGVGVLVALLGAGLFAAAYALLVALLGLLVPGFGLTGALRFTATPTFWIPVIVFALAYVLLVVIVNRAGWWAHVLGGFLVGLVVWVGFVGAAIISAGAFGQAAPVVGAVVAEQLTNPLGFAAAIAAREVPVWVGWIVARRGRTARARNEAARAAYQKELAEHRATVDGRTAV